MPFDYDTYQKKCNVMTKEQLQKEWENYTRQISAGATGTATSVLLMPYTGGLSAVGLGVSAPRIHNARKKREIIEASLQAQGATPHTRKRDVLAAVGVSGAVSGLTLGIVAPGADMAVGAAFHHSVEYAAAQAALGGSGAVLVHTSDQLRNSNGTQEESKPPNTNTLDYSSIQGEHGESVYNMRPHASHSWSFDSASTTETLRTGPLATPYADDESVLFHPILEENENGHDQAARPLVFAEPMDSGISQTAGTADAQQVLLEKMRLLQIEMQKRQTYAQGAVPGVVQASHQQEWGAHLMKIGPGSENEGQGLGIMASEQYHSTQYAIPQLVDYQTQQNDATSIARPQPYQRSESLPATLQPQHYHPSTSYTHRNYGHLQQEQLPSYEQHYIAPLSQPSHQPQEYASPLNLPPHLPARPDRQDSGYCSVSSTPSLSGSASNGPQQHILSEQVSSPQPYAPAATVRHSVSATADTGLRRHNHVHRQHRASESAVSASSTSVAASSSQEPIFTPPPPYSQPSITVTTHPAEKESKDYFSSQASESLDSSPFQTLAKKKSQALLKGVNQGWQWAKAFPVAGDTKLKEGAEPDYGPPPGIPIAWGSR